MFAVFGLLSSGLEAHNIASSKCLGDGKTNELLPREYLRYDTRLEFG